MSLPLILDIAIGLIFIYLVISLLSSEVQELITTLLQWRAEHLKKSIESLLAGGGEVDGRARQLANQLYDDPLIKSLNQEARGLISPLFRKGTQKIGDFYRWITRSRNTFGNKRSGPSYIPSETFATTLMETLKIELLSRKMSELRLRRFVQEQLKEPIKTSLSHLRQEIQSSESLLYPEFKQFEARVEGIIRDFRNSKSALSPTLDRIADQLTRFAVEAKAVLPEGSATDSFLRRLEYLHQGLFQANYEKEVLLNELAPTLPEVLSELNKIREAHQAFKAIRDDDKSNDEEKLAQLSPPLRQSFVLYSEISKTLQEQGENYEKVLAMMPPYLQESLPVLAKRAQARMNSVEQGARQFQQEVEDWFNRSMERASGVYKRNAKGVAIAIGFLLAVVANADTFHVVSRLSKDSVLRNAIADSASQVVNSSASDINTVKIEVDKALTSLPLPIGWNTVNLQEQTRENQGWPLPYMKRVLGWLVSGIAISMGASFWFDLLSKVVNVRNAGKPTERRE